MKSSSHSHTHTHTQLFSVNTISRCFYSERETSRRKRLRSERRHDSCSVSLCWDFSEGVSGSPEEEVGDRLFRR